MRNRDSLPAILPLLVVLFTSALGPASAAAPSAAERAAGGSTAPAAIPGKDTAQDPGAGPGASAPAAAGLPAAPAPAEDTSGAGEAAAKKPLVVESSPPHMVPSLSHDLQFGLAVMPGGGYRIVFPYKESVDCGDANSNMARVCTNRAPFFVDLQPSFGLSESWDFLVDFRFGIEQNVYHHHEIFIMPGFRYWLDTQSHVKFYTTLQGAYDATKQSTSTVSNYDIGVRNSNGLMVEIMRNFGVYLQFGETVGFVRWLSFNVDAGVGVQARVP